MVIKSKIYDFLKKNLGEYLYGFQKNQLDVGLLSGHIDLVNVNFRPDKVNQLLGALGLPIQIKAGLMGKLRLKCHYTSFFTSPVELEIDELLLVFGPITHIAREDTNLYEDDSESLWQVEMEQKIINQNRIIQKNIEIREGTPNMFGEDTPRLKHKKNVNKSVMSEEQHLSNKSSFLPSEDENSKHRRKSKVSNQEEENWSNGNEKNQVKKTKQKPHSEDKTMSSGPIKDKTYENAYAQRPPKDVKSVSEEEPHKEGFMEKYFSKVLKNLTLTVKSVHIRYEDETYSYQNPFAIGFSVSKVEVKNISHEFVFKDSKVQKRAPRKNAIVKEVTLQKVGVYIYSMASVLIPTSLWEATIHSEIGIFEAFPAYEVRELVIQESETLSKGHPSTVIEPTNATLCISFYEEAPVLRIAGVIDKIDCKFSAAMSECVRNFFDYCTNVQIWPLVLRFRPYCRIPEKPEKRERRKERKKRREIIKLWFQYAFAFVKTKRAAIQYVRERKKDNEHFQKLEQQEKFRERIEKYKNGSEQKENFPNPSEISKKSIFATPRDRKIPGTSGIRLDEIVKEYNSKKTVQKSVLKRRPYDGEKYFPKTFTNSDIELTLNTVKVSILDEDMNLSLEIEGFDLNLMLNILLDEMKISFALGGYLVSVKDSAKTIEVLEAGRKKSVFENKNAENRSPALKYFKVFRPAELFVPNDAYLSLNMHEVECQIAPFTLNYSHNALNHFFLIKEAMELDKCFRENLDLRYIKAFKKHCKKHKLQKIVNSDLKKFVLCKKTAEKIVELQNDIEKNIHDINFYITHMLFSYKYLIDGGLLRFNDFSSNSLLEINLPESKILLEKSANLTLVSALGWNFQSPSNPSALYDFLKTIYCLVYEKLKIFNQFNYS